MSIPRPGKKVRGSQTGAPINALFDLLGRRWALGIIWNMGDEPITFRELQEKCGDISPTILNSRLKDLKDSDIIGRALDGYILTARGKELRECLMPLGKWSYKWALEIFQFQKKEKKV